MALTHSEGSYFREPYFPPPLVTFSPERLDSIQSLYQIQHISGTISELAKSALTTGDLNYVMRARNEIAQLSSILVSYSLSPPTTPTTPTPPTTPTTPTELRTPKLEPKETSSPSPPIETSSSNKRKHKAMAANNLYCRSCGTTQTPEWRRGPDGGKSLCNACGLHYAKIIKREVLVPSRKTETASEAMNLRSLLN